MRHDSEACPACIAAGKEEGGGGYCWMCNTHSCFSFLAPKWIPGPLLSPSLERSLTKCALSVTQARQERLIAQVEERRRLRATVVPTDVGEVKALLRQLGQPITLFGEREVGAEGSELSAVAPSAAAHGHVQD